MSKNRIVLAAVGGVIGLAVLVMAVFTYLAYAKKVAAMEGDEAEGTEGLESVVSTAQSLSRKPVYPSAASVQAISSNEQQIAAWRAEAVKIASRGDRVYEATTPAAFKTFIVGDAKRLGGLPGLVSGKLVKPEFDFGPFKDYITGGSMPSETQLAELQRKWDDIATVVEMLAKAGIAELVGVDFAAQDAAKEEQKSDSQKKGARKADRKSSKRAADESRQLEPAACSYVFTFTTRPAGFVKAINALETCERFIVVDGFTFSRSKDVISEALGGEEKKSDAAQPTRGRRGRRGRAAQAEEPAVAEVNLSKHGIVTDPEHDEPMTVVMKATVYDFRSLEKTEEVSK